MIGYGLDRGGPKDSETAPNSFLTEINGNVFWHFAPDIYLYSRAVIPVSAELYEFEIAFLKKVTAIGR